MSTAPPHTSPRSEERAVPRTRSAGCIALAALVISPLAHATLQDEVQVYLDDANQRGQWGLELHLNTTPDGIATADYPGESLSRHGTRLTAELSYGLGSGLEAGLYLPTVADDAGHTDLAGAKVRLKWVAKAATDPAGDWFGGANLEVSRVGYIYEPSRWGAELRFMAGWRDADWTFGVNPVFGFALAGAQASATPDLGLQMKGARTIAQGLALGLEYYSDFGAANHLAGWSHEDNRLYLAADIDRGALNFNVGVGYGLTPASDRWTVKFIFEIPVDPRR